MRSLREVFKPSYCVDYVLGIVWYGSDKNGKTNISFYKIAQAIIIFSAILVLTIIHFDSFLGAMDKDFAKAGTIKILFVFRCVGNLILIFIMCISGYLYIRKFNNKYDEMLSIDTELINMGGGKDIAKANDDVWKKSLILISVVVITFNIISEFLSHWFLMPEFSLIEDLVLLYPIGVINNVKITFYLLTMVLQKRFALINKFIDAKVEDSQRSRKYPLDTEKFSVFVRKAVNLHKSLVKVTREYNDIYSLQLLLCITMNFILLIGDLHTAMYIIFFDLFAKHYKLVIFLLRTCFLYLFDLYYLAKKSMELCEEANRTRIVLLGVRIDIDNEDAHNTVIASTLKLMQNKLSITACKLFNIDNALLFSICAAASSYLFIMLQLDMGDNKDQSNILNVEGTNGSTTVVQ